jgi:hypothetical protein
MKNNTFVLVVTFFISITTLNANSTYDIICNDAIAIHKEITEKVSEAQADYLNRLKNKIPNFISDWLMERDIKKALENKDLALTKAKVCPNSQAIISQWELYYSLSQNIVKENKAFRESLK